MTSFTSSSQLLSRLRSILRRQRTVLFIAGLLVTTAALGGSALLLGLVANIMVVPVWLKLCLMIGSAAVTLYLFSRHALVRLFEGGVEHVASELEERFPDLKGRLIAAVEFSRRPPRGDLLD